MKLINQLLWGQSVMSCSAFSKLCLICPGARRSAPWAHTARSVPSIVTVRMGPSVTISTEHVYVTQALKGLTVRIDSALQGCTALSVTSTALVMLQILSGKHMQTHKLNPLTLRTTAYTKMWHCSRQIDFYVHYKPQELTFICGAYRYLFQPCTTTRNCTD